MKVYERKAIKDWSIIAENGDFFEIKKGKKYTTSETRDRDDTVVVFSNYWVRVPRDMFGKARPL